MNNVVIEFIAIILVLSGGGSDCVHYDMGVNVGVVGTVT